MRKHDSVLAKFSPDSSGLIGTLSCISRPVKLGSPHPASSSGPIFFSVFVPIPRSSVTCTQDSTSAVCSGSQLTWKGLIALRKSVRVTLIPLIFLVSHRPQKRFFEASALFCFHLVAIFFHRRHRTPLTLISVSTVYAFSPQHASRHNGSCKTDPRNGWKIIFGSRTPRKGNLAVCLSFSIFYPALHHFPEIICQISATAITGLSSFEGYPQTGGVSAKEWNLARDPWYANNDHQPMCETKNT